MPRQTTRNGSQGFTGNRLEHPPVRSVKHFNAPGSTHAAHSKHIQRRVPLGHERRQPSSRVIVVDNALVGLEQSTLQVCSFEEVQLVGLSRRDDALSGR